MDYIDAFVAAVPTENKELYLEHAKTSVALFKEYGALRVVECWGDDVPDGKITSFPMAVKCEANETVVFSWVTWPDKKTRDAGMEGLMQDPRMDMEMPFDMTRIIFGGFQMILNE
ncbi:DUF1428 domain-containing protein [Psychrosphaera sp. B3R10]|uniref:DUF1428 domain-containing protein n=1 Tax=Psychrosphaera algicola TaxID=3023714 RepID=A0ABT5F8A5_9GAMM|nr:MULTISPECIES: DUF1428 domain-containing protein [unclassified Psychrosphaera]MBU2882144.1 DUF1428 domain-containing protein [Psychrosphaera sp. I2R16]MBU2988825.1 DUF1428 domain-containing protein [Psychrosphaera sp. B3R10]MDC2887755.1 DUF1428 domain-containing protein [Psychrosphaera sp. G1-22]MDO6717845.1 DUF1428 domain-containing protein [Psychrosphaera sp. 1_MG-2023]